MRRMLSHTHSLTTTDTGGEMAEEQKKEGPSDYLTLPFPKVYGPVLKVAAQREQRTVAGLIRVVMVRWLHEKGYLDDNFRPLVGEEDLVELR